MRSEDRFERVREEFGLPFGSQLSTKEVRKELVERRLVRILRTQRHSLIPQGGICVILCLPEATRRISSFFSVPTIPQLSHWPQR